MTNKDQNVIPESVAKCGHQSSHIFMVLLTHEVMTEETISEKVGATGGVSAAMTALRRTGWVECTGERGALKWKRRTVWKEPQPDFTAPRNTVAHHLREAKKHIDKAMEKSKTLAAFEKAFRNVDMSQLGNDDDES